jgi:1-acyl-sn-glycerol-3-phosphate acyltransferase
MSTYGDWTPWQRFLVYGSRVMVWLPTLGRVKAEGLERVSADQSLRSGPLIVVANHASNIDPPLVAGWLGPTLRRGSTVLAKEELFHGPLGPFMRRSGIVMVKTGGSDVDAYRVTKAVLDRGDVILLFPEGTRSPSGIVGKGHAGVAMLAAREGVRVLPVGLSGTDRLLGKGRSWPRIGTPVAIRVGDPFVVTLDPALPRRQALLAASDEVMRRVSDLVDERQRGHSTEPEPEPEAVPEAEAEAGPVPEPEPEPQAETR